MTASIRDSLITSDLPKELKSAWTSFNSSGVTFWLTHNALIASQTKAGVFGMARTSLTGLPKESSMAAIVFPAAMDTITHPDFIWEEICGITSSNLFGFTARNKISLRSATVSLDRVVSMEYVLCSFSKVAAEWALAMIWLVVTNSECTIPPIMALPIFPAPMKPIILSIIYPPCLRSKCDCSCRSRGCCLLVCVLYFLSS